MTKFLFLFLLTFTLLQAKSQTMSYSQPPNDILLKNRDSNLTPSLYIENSYHLKRGWNHFTTPKDGLDVEKTFYDVDAVYVYDKHSSLWAIYSPKHKSTLTIKYIEPHQDFYVLSTKNITLNIVSKTANAQCQRVMQNKNYELLSSSGIDEAFTFNSSKTIAIKSRYLSHTRKGIYNDSRVLLIVPKLKEYSQNKKYKKYGPAIPKMKLLFNEAYIEKVFYVYDFLEESCYKGIFPSKRVPPMPVMKKVK